MYHFCLKHKALVVFFIVCCLASASCETYLSFKLCMLVDSMSTTKFETAFLEVLAAICMVVPVIVFNWVKNGYLAKVTNRLHIIRSLAVCPVVLLLDEVTVGLDPASAKQVMCALLTSEGLIIFAVTHVVPKDPQVLGFTHTLCIEGGQTVLKAL